MKNYVKSLEAYEKTKDFLVCIDSDGCTFDNMDIKWKECFIPALIKCFELQPIAKYVREETERINLYSRTRGINRFAGLPLLFDALEEREEVESYNFRLPDMEVLKAWAHQTNKLSVDSLQEVFKATGDVAVERALIWSAEVNKVIEEMIYGIPPFPFVSRVMEKIKEHANIAVVSSANTGSLEVEWTEHGLTQYVDILGGQEIGTKKEYIHKLKEFGYQEENILMIGDALGDLDAAKANGVLFYPIIPGEEAKFWETLFDNIVDKFIDGTYKGKDACDVISKFEEILK